MNQEPTLSLSLSTPGRLKAVEHNLFDRIFLGYPFCLQWPDNQLADPQSLFEGLKNFPQPEKIVLRLPIRPLENQLPLLKSLLETAGELGLGGAAFDSIAMSEWVKAEFPQGELYLDNFSAVYTGYDVKLAAELGVKGIVPAPELGIDEREALLGLGTEIITPLHGYLPLAFSRYCFFHPQIPEPCDHICQFSHILSYPQGKIKQKGKALFSDASLCCLPQLPGWLKKGFRSFRLEGLLMSPEQIDRCGEVYRGALAGGEHEIPPDWAELFPEGFCNGFYSGARGIDFITERS